MTYREAEKGLKAILKRLFKLFKSITTSIYRKHFAGVKRIEKDGPTPDKDEINGMTYDEFQKAARDYKKDGIEFVAKAHKVGGSDYNSKRTERLSKEIDEAKEKYRTEPTQKNKKKIDNLQDKYSKIQAKHNDRQMNTNDAINKFNKISNKLENAKEEFKKSPTVKNKEKVDKLQKKYDAKAEEFKDYSFTIITNRRHQAYNNEKRKDIIENRAKYTENLFKKDFDKSDTFFDFEKEKFDKFYDSLKNDGKFSELTKEQIEHMYKDINKSGTVDVESFKGNYFVHTVDMKRGGQIVYEMQNDVKDFGVEKLKDKDGKGYVNIYVKEDDLGYYNSKSFADTGSFQHIGRADKKVDIKDSSTLSTLRVPVSSVKKMNKIMKDEDYFFRYTKDKKGNTVAEYTFKESAVQRAKSNQKDTTVKEDIDAMIKEERQRDKTETYEALHKSPSERNEYVSEHLEKNDSREVKRYNETLGKVEEAKGTVLNSEEMNDFINAYTSDNPDKMNDFILNMQHSSVNTENTKTANEGPTQSQSGFSAKESSNFGSSSSSGGPDIDLDLGDKD